MSQPLQAGLDLGRFMTGPSKPDRPRPAGPGGDVSAIVSRERRAREILAGIDELPSLPTVITRVLRMANDPRSNASDFEAVVRSDQALAARVLKLVNSSFFGLPTRLSSISQAIVILGFKTLRSLILAASTSRLLDGQLTRYGIEPGGLWRHSVGAASLARFFALRLGLGAEVAEELFVAGLLHDMGKIVLAPHLEEIDTAVAGDLRNPDDVAAVEERHTGITHAAAGAIMAEKWNLSKNVAEWIRKHHDEQGADDDRALMVVRLADAACLRRGIGLAGGVGTGGDTYDRLLHASGLVSCEAEIEENVERALGELQTVLDSAEGR